MSRRRTAGLVGAVAGAVAVGAAAGLAAERYAVGRVRLAPDPEADEPFFRLPADRSRTVFADDGVALHVEEVGPDDADVTVVFCHGYTLQLASWHYQRKALALENPGKLVFWDQRSHGHSGRSSHENSTIDHLGHDLRAVLDACAPIGKLVLVGHSMGGMTIMALAQHHPELFEERVAGVALIATSPGQLIEVALGVPTLIAAATDKVMTRLSGGMRRRPALFEKGRQLGTDLAFVLTRRGSFGSKDVPPSLVEFTEQMIKATPVDVIGEFWDTFLDHDKLAALPVLAGVETLVLVGSKDVVTPVDHSRAIAHAVPTAQLVVVEGAGHMVMLEREALVTLQLRALVRRSLARRRRTA
jgi:pimeloyl-ACP methyl ester carboxylesterase